MRKRRTIYFDDARHYYLFVFEPPMTMEDAWSPVDQVVGTAVNTFAYGVARGDGLFYPSRVGTRFGTDIQSFEKAAYWRVWQNMQSLMDRGLDPLRVLIDRAHEKGMDFVASLRIGNYSHMHPTHNVSTGGRGFAHQEVRDHQLSVLRELALDYPVEGIELDIASAPGGGSFLVRDEDVAEYTPTITEWVREVASMARSRKTGPVIVGARIYPTEEMCLKRGLDVRKWLSDGLVDYVVPLLYMDPTLDPDMPIDWLIEVAHKADASVYGMLHPYVATEETGGSERRYASTDNTHAATSNFWDRGVDGMYTWFMRWPLGDEQRRTLSELGDPEAVKEATKHYVLRRRSEEASSLGYDAELPVTIESDNHPKRHSVAFYVSDDFDRSDRIRSTRLRILIRNLVSADNLVIELNGRSLANEPVRRDYGDKISPYDSQWLEFDLRTIHPRKGNNSLDFVLISRPAGLAGTLVVEEIELLVEYGPYPSKFSS